MNHVSLFVDPRPTLMVDETFTPELVRSGVTKYSKLLAESDLMYSLCAPPSIPKSEIATRASLPRLRGVLYKMQAATQAELRY